MTFEEREQMIAIVQQGHELLERFLADDPADQLRAWEMVVQLQELVEQMRELRPPRTFRRTTG